MYLTLDQLPLNHSLDQTGGVPFVVLEQQRKRAGN